MTAPKVLTADDLSPAQRERINDRVAQRMESIERFVVREARSVPRGLLDPLARADYLALPVDERRTHLRERVREQLTAEAVDRMNASLAEKAVALAAKAAAAEAAEAERAARIAREYRPGAYLVPCAHSLCDQFAPVPGARPARRFCPEHSPRR